MAYDWIPGVALAGCAGVLNWYLTSKIADTKMGMKLTELEKHSDQVAERLERATEHMNRAAVDFQKVQGEQNLINGYTTKLLDALAERVEAIGKTSNDNAQSISLMREIMVSKGLLAPKAGSGY